MNKTEIRYCLLEQYARDLRTHGRAPTEYYAGWLAATRHILISLGYEAKVAEIEAAQRADWGTELPVADLPTDAD